MASPHDSAEAAELDAKVIAMKSSGMTFREIASELGFAAQSYVYSCYQRGKRRIVEPAVTEYRAKQLARIEAERLIAEEILHATHPVVSNGRVFNDLEDAGPKLSALDRLVKLDNQESDLLGLKAPTRVEAMVTETTQQDLELAEMIREAKAANARTEAELRGQP